MFPNITYTILQVHQARNLVKLELIYLEEVLLEDQLEDWKKILEKE